MAGLLQASEVAADAAADPKALAADLANERTLLAWVRTGLAAIRRLFGLGGRCHEVVFGPERPEIPMGFGWFWGRTRVWSL